MKVWIVEGNYDYDGSNIEHVCLNEEDAQRLSKEMEKHNDRNYDYISVTDHEVVE